MTICTVSLEQTTCWCGHSVVWTEHVPEHLVDCEACGGAGYTPRTIHVYEAGCGFSHPDVEEVMCEACGGNGWFLCEAS